MIIPYLYEGSEGKGNIISILLTKVERETLFCLNLFCVEHLSATDCPFQVANLSNTIFLP